LPQRFDVAVIGRVDVQRDLERQAGDSREVNELTKLVRSQAERPAAVFNRPVRPAPRADRRERRGWWRRLGSRPKVEDDRLWRRQPIPPARRYQAVGLTDVLADSDEGVMASEYVGEAEVAPHLTEPGVEVDENS